MALDDNDIAEIRMAVRLELARTGEMSDRSAALWTAVLTEPEPETGALDIDHFRQITRLELSVMLERALMKQAESTGGSMTGLGVLAEDLAKHLIEASIPTDAPPDLMRSLQASMERARERLYVLGVVRELLNKASDRTGYVVVEPKVFMDMLRDRISKS